MKNSQKPASPTDAEVVVRDKYQIRKLGGLTKLEWMAGQVVGAMAEKILDDSFKEDNKKIKASVDFCVHFAEEILKGCEKRSE